MFNRLKFKKINMYDGIKKFRYSKEFYEIKCEPSCKGDPILLCNKKCISFDELLYLLFHTINQTNILGIVSVIYYEYSKEFIDYLDKCTFKEFKIIKIKCGKKFKNLYLFLQKSDDLLFPQNENIRKIYSMLWKNI